MYIAILTTILPLASVATGFSNASTLSESTNNRGTHAEDLPDIASIVSVPPASFVSYAKGNLIRDNLLSSLTGAQPPSAAKIEKQWTCATSPTFTWGDADNGGVGVTITNADFDWRAFYIYQNLCDYVPLKYLWIAAQHTVFVSLPQYFQGRITRGTDEVRECSPLRPIHSLLTYLCSGTSAVFPDPSEHGSSSPSTTAAGSGATSPSSEDVTALCCCGLSTVPARGRASPKTLWTVLPPA